MNEDILIEVQESIAVVTINRPKFLNALNVETIEQLDQTISDLEGNTEINAVVLTGAGEKSFVSGGDISVMQKKGPMEAHQISLLAHKLMNHIEQSPMPVIAAVNGFALGGGCQLAMSCDIRIASEKAKFGQPEINLGIIPGWSGTQRLPRLIGRGRAMELLLTGDLIDAHEAERIGLVNRVVAAEDLLNEACALAHKIASKSRLAIATCKKAVNNGMEMDIVKAGEYEAGLFGQCFSTEDQKEGMAAFLEKRKPKFKGR